MKIASWRTTTAGVATVVSAIALALSAALDNDPATVPDWNALTVAVLAGFGLMSARDDKVSSEKAGAK